MKEIGQMRKYFLTLVYAGSVLGFVFFLSLATYGQARNSISGHVFGLERRPVTDIYVELMDEFGRTMQRVRTNASGMYFFNNLGDGRFKVKVMPLGTDYEEQEQDVEIVNFRQAQPGGGGRIVGGANESRDFQLRLRKGANPGILGTVFVQEIPPAAKKHYEAAVQNLESKKAVEAYAQLKAAIEIFPKYFAALEMLGIEYVKAASGKVEYAQAGQVLLTMALDVNPRAYQCWYYLALSLYQQNKQSEALQAANKALEIQPTAAESLLLAGSILRQSKDYAEAEKRLIKARESASGGLPQVHMELALLYTNGLKRYNDAAKELKTYLKVAADLKEEEKIKIKKLIVDLEKKGSAG